MSERLTKRDENGNAYYDWGCLNRNHWVLGRYVDRLAEYEDSGLSPDEVQELAKAKADGRLVVLPCKVGDAVWKIKSAFSYFTKPMEDRVERIIIYKNEILVCCTSGAKFSIGSVGKTVFLTREAAEKALEVGE